MAKPMSSSSLVVICVKECDNSSFLKEIANIHASPVKFIPGEKYDYHNCEKKTWNYIYRIEPRKTHTYYNYCGCITKDFLDENFITYKTVDDVDKLFDKAFYDAEE